jgi:hypothetical protein
MEKALKTQLIKERAKTRQAKKDAKALKVAKDLIDEFIELNHEHAMTSTEGYGMSYLYHAKCALIVSEAMEAKDISTQLHNIIKAEQALDNGIKIRKS